MTPTYHIHNMDCIEGMAAHLEPESCHLCVTSIPFGALFQYSAKTEDIGNNHDGLDMRASEFGLNMRFFIEQLRRVMAPGAVVCIHIQQLIATKVQHGFMGRRDLRAAVVDLFGAGGFDWTGEVAIPKNPQSMAQRLKLHSLMFGTGARDSRAWAPAMNDYVMIFRKPGEGRPVPALYYPKQGNTDGWLTTEDWIRWASGVWHDIMEIDVLDGYKSARETDEEKHVCPLQLEVIRRCVLMYSNPGDTVIDPFGGIGSTGWVCLGAPSPTTGLAVNAPRNVVLFELKESYYDQALRNCRLALDRRHTADSLPLLDWLDTHPVEEVA